MGKYVYDTKIGKIAIFEAMGFITKILLNQEKSLNDNITSTIQLSVDQIDEYLSGKRRLFNIPYKITGTDFQKRILTVISKIPYGEKWSYSKVAKEAGFEGASRAVGSVCSNNILPIIIPCHRVNKKDGSIGQYLGGKQTKKYLLELEKCL